MDEKVILKKQMLSEALQGVLDKAKVPMRHHLKALEALHKAFADHTADRQNFDKTLQTALKQVETHGETVKESKATLSQYREEATRLQTIEHLKGDPGEPGIGRDGAPGKDGVSPPMDVIVRAVLDQIPKPKPGKDGQTPETKALVEVVLKEIQKGDKLHISHVKGAGAFMKDGIRYRFEELMHGSGTAGSVVRSYDLSSQCDGANKTFTIPTFTRIITLIATDAPIIYRPTTDFTATGTTLTMTAAVNAPSLGSTLILTYVV